MFDVDINLNGINTKDLLEKLNLYNAVELLEQTKEKLDIYSYHYYNGVSERGFSIGIHWDESHALDKEYLDVAGDMAKQYAKIRDKFIPDGQIWVTESGDAACGGNPLEYINEKLPELKGEKKSAGGIICLPASCTFIVI